MTMDRLNAMRAFAKVAAPGSHAIRTAEPSRSRIRSSRREHNAEKPAALRDHALDMRPGSRLFVAAALHR